METGASVIANEPSSTLQTPPAAAVDLAASGMLSPLPAAWLAGRDLDLLAPLRIVPAAGLPPLLRPPAVDRRPLAAELGLANRGYGHPLADRLAARLADPATRVVVTGQQPGLLGGPLYTVAKAMAASRWAAELEAAGEPAVAVFWVATEDHDWAEVSRAAVPTASGIRTFDLGPDPEPLAPVGMRTLGPAVETVLSELAAAVPGERYAEWLRAVARWYRPEARFGEAFTRLLVQMLGERCPLLLDAMHPALKSAERPFLRRLVEQRDAVEAVYAERDAAIRARGYHLQVSPQRGASPLFLLSRGERRKVEWRAEGFGLRGREEGGSLADLLRVIAENPAVVSPGVLARPAIQDAVLGTTVQVMGPGELSYMAQVSAVYPLLEIEPPLTSLRPQTLIIEAHQLEKLGELGLSLADLLGDRAHIDHILVEREGGDFLTPIRARIEAALAELHAPALAADPNLERPLDKTREQILRSFDLFGEKATAALARRNEVVSRRVEQLREICLPLGKLQEREITAAHYQGKYGERFAASYWEQLGLDPTRLQVIVP
jgi:bacillithiol biosynthesis cysteine-adding enzyme BshC